MNKLIMVYRDKFTIVVIQKFDSFYTTDDMLTNKYTLNDQLLKRLKNLELITRKDGLLEKQ